MSVFVISIIRTWVPILVGGAIAWIVTVTNLPVDPEATLALSTTITLVGIMLYYALIRWLETKFPWIGWLLGYAKAPALYVNPETLLSTSDNRLVGSTSSDNGPRDRYEATGHGSTVVNNYTNIPPLIDSNGVTVHEDGRIIVNGNLQHKPEVYQGPDQSDIYPPRPKVHPEFMTRDQLEDPYDAKAHEERYP